MERLELGDSEVILKDDPEDPYDNFEEVNYNIFLYLQTTANFNDYETTTYNSTTDTISTESTQIL